MELQDEELETFTRLRAKYAAIQGDSASAMPLDPNAPGAESWRLPIVASCPPAGTVSHTKGANVEARMCPTCQGLGVQVEVYEHRRLEKQCKTCSGRGISLFRDGVEVVEALPDASSPVTTTTGMDTPVWTDMSNDKADKLQADIQAINDKYTKCQQQVTQAEEALAKSVSDAEERRLREALLNQLKAYAKKLRGALMRKEAQIRLAGRL